MAKTLVPRARTHSVSRTATVVDKHPYYFVFSSSYFVGMCSAISFFSCTEHRLPLHLNILCCNCERERQILSEGELDDKATTYNQPSHFLNDTTKQTKEKEKLKNENMFEVYVCVCVYVLFIHFSI